MTLKMIHSAKQRGYRRLGTLVLTGALAISGLTAAQLASAAPSEAAICNGKMTVSKGSAYAKNTCGWAYAEVGRVINGKTLIAYAQVKNKAVSVTWTQGSRSHEKASIW